MFGGVDIFQGFVNTKKSRKPYFVIIFLVSKENKGIL